MSNNEMEKPLELQLGSLASDIHELQAIFQKLMEGVQESSIVLLDKHGTILTWNKGLEKLKGYKADEIIGQHISIFYLPEDRQTNLPKKLLHEAAEKGRAFFVGKRIRKNGTIFWGRIEITAIKNNDGEIIGFTKMATALSSTTELGDFWFDNDGILHIVASRELRTPEKIANFKMTLLSALKGQKICCVIDIRDAELSHLENSFTQSPVSDIYKAIAFVSGTPVDQNTEMVIKVIPKEVPTQIVSSMQEGNNWARQFLR
jgi:PAS domain S-box-containing protein